MMKSTEPVEVYCRLRPTDETDVACVQEISDTVVEFTPPPNLKSAASTTPKVTQATFTGIFSAESFQEDVFNRTAYELVSDLINGKNGLLFTYGVTGSGKTHTMLGNPQNPGILPRCLDTIFNSVSRHLAKPFTFICDKMNGFEVQPDDNLAEIQRGRERLKPALPFARKAPTLTTKKDDLDWELFVDRVCETAIVTDVDDDNAFSVFVSYVQIYNNYVYDLLDVPESTNNPNNPPKLESKILREDRKHNMYVYGAVEVEVKSTDEAFNIFIKGQKFRRVANTLLNQESSRSHSIFNIRVVQAPYDRSGQNVIKDRSKIHVSQLSLVDLAGSERNDRTGSTGERLKEAGNINFSLMNLRSCLEILRENQNSNSGAVKLVPYRETKLTHLFKNYFDGEGRVRMIVCVNPMPDDYDESLRAVQFAELVKEVEIVKANAVNFDEIECLTPGRRRAAQRVLEMKTDSVALPSAPTYSVFFDDMSSEVSLNGPDDEDTISDLRKYFENRQLKRSAFFAEALLKQHNFEDALDGFVSKFDDMKKEFPDVLNRCKSLSDENRKLASQSKAAKHQVSTLQLRLGRYEQEHTYRDMQEAQLKKNEQNLASRFNVCDEKLRAVKEICDRTPVLVSQNVAGLKTVRAEETAGTDAGFGGTFTVPGEHNISSASKCPYALRPVAKSQAGFTPTLQQSRGAIASLAAHNVSGLAAAGCCSAPSAAGWRSSRLDVARQAACPSPLVLQRATPGAYTVAQYKANFRHPSMRRSRSTGDNLCIDDRSHVVGSVNDILFGSNKFGASPNGNSYSRMNLSKGNDVVGSKPLTSAIKGKKRVSDEKLQEVASKRCLRIS